MFWVLHGMVMMIGILLWEYLNRLLEFFFPKKFQELDNPSFLWLPPEKGTVLITGGTSGVGKETALRLAKLGYRVLLTCRDEKRGKEVLKEIREAAPNNQKVELHSLDLLNLGSVRSFCKKLKDRNLPIHLLINNAGAAFPTWQIGADGMERTFQTNHAGHFLLTNLLMDNLKMAHPPARIVHVASAGAFLGKVSPSSLLSKPLLPSSLYLDSKLCNILFSMELQRRLEKEGRKDILSVSAHPGAVSTGLYRRFPGMVQGVISLLFQSQERGARTQLYLALAPPKKLVPAGFYAEGNSLLPLPWNASPLLARSLWEKTAQMVSFDQ